MYVAGESHNREKIKYNAARSKLNTIDKANSASKWITFLLSLIISILSYWIQYMSYVEKKINMFIQFDKKESFLISIIIFLFSFVFIYAIFKITFFVESRKYSEIIFKYEIENMQDSVDDDLFESSLKMSYKYLDQYYSQTREQAQNGFLITIIVTISGAILLAVGIISLFTNKTDTSAITVAGGVVVEFISAVMFYLYNKTNQSMSNYHDKLYLSQNIAIALQISDSVSDEKKDDIKCEIVKELISNVNSNIFNTESKENTIGNKKDASKKE